MEFEIEHQQNIIHTVAIANGTHQNDGFHTEGRDQL
jgi:hypothetical protein